MTKKKWRWRTAGPDDPIYKEGLTIYTPFTARPGFKLPEPKKPDEVDDKPAEDE